jgi:uracil-DNA glycosylase
VLNQDFAVTLHGYPRYTTDIEKVGRRYTMRVSEHVRCADFPCADVNHERYIVPGVNVKPRDVSIVMISEAAPADLADYYYARGNPVFEQTTVQAFNDAGAEVKSIKDILGLGVYLTTAVKCGKINYSIQTSTLEECSRLLEQELALFPNVQVWLLMGDVAIKAVNAIARRTGQGRVIPAGSTYKIRGQPYHFQGRRVFPSYLQAGPSFFIEKSKRKMIAQDIAAALALVR